MKKSIRIIFAIITLLLYTNYSSAQKVVYDEDTIKIDGKPHAIMKKKNAGPMRSDFAVSSLSGTELIYFKSTLRTWTGSGFKFGANEEIYYQVNFIATGSKADLKYYNGNGFAKLVVENNLIKGNATDPESEKRFIQLNNGWFPRTPKSEPDKSPAVVVNINNNNGGSGDNTPTPTVTAPKSKSPVILTGNQIIRDEVVIGKFKQETTSSAYSQKTTVVTIYSEGGEKVAEASVPVENPQEWNVKTFSDNKTFNILYDSPNEKEKLFKWLADKNYLTN
ncbi:MAG: hypothetical protein ACO1N0_15935 [Fluviicola sp.]